MVSSYLVCEVCGAFGPPAGFLKEQGLRLCYQCWYQERLSHDSTVLEDNNPSSAPTKADSLQSESRDAQAGDQQPPDYTAK